MATFVSETSRQVQLDSWARDHHGRRRLITLGHVRSFLRQYPDDLRDVVVAAVEAANEDGES